MTCAGSPAIRKRQRGAGPASLACSLAAAWATSAAAQAPLIVHFVAGAPRPWSAEASARPLPLAPQIARPPRPSLAIPLASNVTLIANSGKGRALRDWAPRRTDGPAGSSRGSRGVRLGLVVNW